MAYQKEGSDMSLEAAADLSAHQYKLVVVDATGKAALAGDNADADGILQNKPTAGQTARIQREGESKFVGAGAIAAGSKIGSNATGQGKLAVVGSHVIGKVLVDPGAAGQIGTMLIKFQGILA
jgi:hypothetical protein